MALLAYCPVVRILTVLSYGKELILNGKNLKGLKQVQKGENMTTVEKLRVQAKLSEQLAKAVKIAANKEYKNRTVAKN
jgi:hypothetical protein